MKHCTYPCYSLFNYHFNRLIIIIISNNQSINPFICPFQMSPILIGLGNPLLDITAYYCAEKELLGKYGLKENGHILVGDQNKSQYLKLFDEVTKLGTTQLLPGGSVMNTIRVFQWILNTIRDNKDVRATMFGAIGDDSYAKFLIEKISEIGVDPKFQRIEGVAAGKCVSLISGENRSLCAYLDAASHFTIDFLKLPENTKLIESAQCFYTAAFFLSVCPEAILYLARNAAAREKPFVFNLSAAYIPDRFKEQLNAVIPFVDILFANEDEAIAYAKSNEFKSTGDLHQIALDLIRIEKINKKRNRMVIITRGNQPVILAENGQSREISIISIPKDELVDTNGAGDAFCGGFLAAFVSGRPQAKCLQWAMFAAATIIRRRGCTFPDKCDELM